MKKLSLVLGFALMASMVFSQNTATINQSGNAQKATVAQAGVSNSASVDQLNLNNTVSVDTKGNRNAVVVEQNGANNGSGSIPVANMGYVKQDGDDNKATLKEGLKDGSKSAYDSDGLINQKGNQNDAQLIITGQYMNFTNHGITQIQDRATKGNTAVITQTSYNSDMDVYQKGSENLTTGTTLGQNNQFFVDQTGIKNTATVSQLGSDNGEFGYYWGWNSGARNWNILSQSGDNNIGSVIQESGSKFKMTQIGDLNTAKISQLGNNVVTTLQNGNSNIIGGILNCVPTDVAVFVSGASMDATQLGNNNKLWVSTAGALTVVQNSTTVGALALGNTIKYTQTAAGVVGLTQTGDNNLIWLKNTSATVPMDVDVDQIGNGNQVGSTFVNGVATTCATFAGSHLDVDQIGDLNSLHLNSTGALDVVDVMQNGTSNWASVTQSASLGN